MSVGMIHAYVVSVKLSPTLLVESTLTGSLRSVTPGGYTRNELFFCIMVDLGYSSTKSLRNFFLNSMLTGDKNPSLAVGYPGFSWEEPIILNV